MYILAEGRKLLDELKKASSKHVIRISLLLGGVILVGLLVLSTSIIKLIKGPVDLDSLSKDELKGAYVEAEIDLIFGNFATLSETKSGTTKITNEYYIIPVGDYAMIGLDVNASYFAEAGRIMNSESLTTKPMHIKGTIKNMDKKLTGYYDDWFGAALADLDYEEATVIKESALKYVLVADKVGLFNELVIYIGLVICLIILVILIIILVRYFTGLNLRNIKDFLKKNEATDQLSKVESDYYNAVQIEGDRFGKLYTFYINGTTPFIIRNKDIIWAYLKRTTQKTYGIKTNVIYELVINTRSKKTHSIHMKTEDSVTAALEQYSLHNPHIILGYNSDLKKTYNRNFNEFLNMSQRQENEHITNDFISS